MTVSTTTAKSGPYAGSGTTGPFTVGFRFLENSHILVVKNVAGVETNLVLDTDYTVTGAGASSGSVTLATALATGQTLTIVRNVPTTQETDYVAGDSFPAESHERALDQLTMIAQQLKEEVDRSAKLPVSSTADADSLVADIVRLADSADEIDAVADIEASVVTVAGIDSEVATVAGIAANVTTVAGVSGNVTTVAGISSNVTTVAGVASNVTTVAGVSSAVTTVAGISAAVSTVAADGTDIGAVAAISADVQAVADIATDVSAVENIAANVTTVAGIQANVTTVAGISSAVSGVAAISAAVSAVNSNATNINAVNSNATNINAVAGNATNINAVNANATNINAVAANGTDIDTVAANIADINTTVDNLAAILDAPNQATAAANSAAAAAASAASGMYSAVQDKSADYTVVAGDAGDLIRVTTTGGARTITLPAISAVSDGFKVAIVKWTGDTNAVTVARSSSDTINGATTYAIGSQYNSATFVADAETSQWFAVASGLGSTNVVVDPFNGTGAQTAFTLSGDPGTENNTQVFVGGVYQEKDTYSVSGTTLTFSSAPPSGTSNIEVVWTQPLPVGVPGNDTVSTAKLQDGAVTTAKLAANAVTAAKVSTNEDFTFNSVRVGRGAGAVSTNTAVGASALATVSSSAHTTAVGNNALNLIASNGYATAVGSNALSKATAANNTAVGAYAGQNTTTGADNLFLGEESAVANTTGSYNVAVGRTALYSNTTASNNTAVGYQAGYSATTLGGQTMVGYQSGLNTTGVANTFFGNGAGSLVTSGAKNTIIGRYDGNTGGLDIRTDSNNVVLSDGDGEPLLRIRYGQGTWWRNAIGTGAGTNALKFNTTTKEMTYDTSSARYKDNIRDSVYGLEAVMALRSAMFEYKKELRTDVGLIAEEVDLVIPELVGKNEEGQPDSVAYDRMVSVCIKAIQELKAEIDTLKGQA